ncbi:hypothetical protein GBF38_014365 [Nibea albiflora]|uniref:Uncharacterized protein n=1 Tax=Nibea albiflora TaxID=240163 RepID=A0ACB7F7D6_NIBAL|nr:hypothetical protein GBF38_014365 [Nibea albiflora]
MQLLPLILGIVLLPKACALVCHGCEAEGTETCKDEEVMCSPSTDQCYAMRMTSYSACTLKCYECAPDASNTCEDKEVTCPPSGDQCAAMRVILYVEPSRPSSNGKKCQYCNGPQCSETLHCEGKEVYCVTAKAYTLRCSKCIQTSSGACIEKDMICSYPGSQCASERITTYAGGFKINDLQMKSCVVDEQCGESSINFGMSRHVITTKCCTTDFCNTQPAPEPSRHRPNGKKCYHCNGPICSETVNCEGNEDHCITKTVLSGGEKKIVKGCASRQLCLSTINAEIKGAIGGTFTCCQGNNCNSASSTSAGLLLLAAPLVSVVMFS